MATVLPSFPTLSVSVCTSVCLPLSLCLCLSLSVCLSVSVSLSLSLCQSVCLSLPVSVSLSLSHSVSVSLHLSVSVCLSLFLCLSLSVSLSLSLSLSLSTKQILQNPHGRRGGGWGWGGYNQRFTIMHLCHRRLALTRRGRLMNNCPAAGDNDARIANHQEAIISLFLCSPGRNEPVTVRLDTLAD